MPDNLKSLHPVAAGSSSQEDSLQAKFEVLEAVGLAIASPSPVEMVVGLVLDLLLQAVPAEAGTIFLLDAFENMLRFAVTRSPHPEPLQDLLLPLGQGIAGWVVQEDQHAVVPDVASDPRFAAWVDEKTGFETRSALCVPLRTRHGVIGAVELLNRKEGEFSEPEAVYVTSIANQTAQLIENVRLFQEQEQTMDTMRALGIAARWLNSSLNIQSVLANIVRMADKVIQAEAGSILLLDEDGHLHFEVALAKQRPHQRPIGSRYRRLGRPPRRTGADSRLRPGSALHQRRGTEDQRPDRV